MTPRMPNTATTWSKESRGETKNMKYEPIKVRVTGQVYRHEFEAVVGNTSGIKKTKCRGFYVEKASLGLDEDAPESRLGTVDIDNEKIIKKEIKDNHVLVYSLFNVCRWRKNLCS